MREFVVQVSAMQELVVGTMKRGNANLKDTLLHAASSRAAMRRLSLHGSESCLVNLLHLAKARHNSLMYIGFFDLRG